MYNLAKFLIVELCILLINNKVFLKIFIMAAIFILGNNNDKNKLNR